MIGIVVIAASAGGLDPRRRIIAALPLSCLAAIFVVTYWLRVSDGAVLASATDQAKTQESPG
jgi:hypothetical protein